MRAGRLAPSGDPRPWQSGEVTPIGNLARFLGRQPVNGIEWYFPKRLTLDVDGASTLPARGSAMARLLKLRTFHARSIDVPLYAFETDLTDGRVLRGARRLLDRSSIARRDATLVDRGSSTSHLDPLTAAPATNDFVKTVSPFLRRAAR